MEPTPREHPRFRVIPRPSDQVAIFFSGSSAPDHHFHWWKIANRIDANVILVNNGLNQWYQNGVPGLGDSYEENYANLKRIVEIIQQVRPNARIVMTVSPVALARTFGDQDIVSANSEGKSILRAAVGAIAREFDAVTYFPSYELVMANSPFSFREDDGRHVASWIVSKIVKTFKAAHCTTD